MTLCQKICSFFKPSNQNTMNPILESLVNLFVNAAPAVAGANPVVSLGLFTLEEAIKAEPALAAELKVLFATGVVTPEQLSALRAKVASESYAGFVPDSALPASSSDPSLTPATPAPETTTAPPLAANQVILDGVVHTITGS
jgi:hypothetical protein